MRIDPFVPLPLIAAGVAATIAVAVARRRRHAPAAGITRTVMMVVLAAVIALDPTVAGGSSDARRAMVDVLFVVDSTSSMAALDYDGDSPRLDGVRADIADLAARFPGAHFSLVRFDSQAHIELPWTTDVAALETAVAVLRQERAAFSTGSELDLPVELIDLLLPRSSIGADGHSVVFYFSDGEQRPGDRGDLSTATEQTARVLGAEGDGVLATSFAELASIVDGGAVLGYGTPDGAPMLEFLGAQEVLLGLGPRLVEDHDTGDPAISRLGEANLVAIADQLGVPYLHRTEPGGLGDLAASIAADAPVAGDGSRESRQRLYWIPALVLFALVLWQAAITSTEALATRRLFAPAGTRVPRRPPAANLAPSRRKRVGEEQAA